MENYTYPAKLYDSPATLTRNKLQKMFNGSYQDRQAFINEHAPYPALDEDCVTIYVETVNEAEAYYRRRAIMFYKVIPEVFWSSDEYNLKDLLKQGYVYACYPDNGYEDDSFEDPVFDDYSNQPVMSCTGDQAAFIAWAGANNVNCIGYKLSLRTTIRPLDDDDVVPEAFQLNTDINKILADSEYAYRFARFWQPVKGTRNMKQMWEIPEVSSEAYREWHGHMSTVITYIEAIKAMKNVKRHHQSAFTSPRPNKRHRG